VSALDGNTQGRDRDPAHCAAPAQAAPLGRIAVSGENEIMIPRIADMI